MQGWDDKGLEKVKLVCGSLKPPLNEGRVGRRTKRKENKKSHLSVKVTHQSNELRRIHLDGVASGHIVAYWISAVSPFCWRSSIHITTFTR